MAISLGSARRAAAQRPILLPPRLTEAEALAHRAFIATLGEEAVWRHYAAGDVAPRAVSALETRRTAPASRF